MKAVYFSFGYLAVFYFYFICSVYRGLINLPKQKQKKIPDEFVSVLIPFRNESENILISLESIKSQDYPSGRYEVIYINDNSDDDSLEKISAANKPENIKVISVPSASALQGHKKLAIMHALKTARGGIIVTTDCDCFHGQLWLSTLLSEFDEDTAFVSGPVEFTRTENIFARLQHLEFMGLVLCGAGLIGSGSPVICNAANLAYKRKVFDEVNGFSGNLKLSSGDDELLMQKIAKLTNYKIKFCFASEAVTGTMPNESLKQFYRQRTRWASKSLFYIDKMLIAKLVLIFFFYLSLICFLAAGIVVSPVFLGLFIAGLLMKIIPEFLVLSYGQRSLFKRENLSVFFLAEILHIPYIIICAVAGLFGNYKWKGRKLER